MLSYGKHIFSIVYVFVFDWIVCFVMLVKLCFLVVCHCSRSVYSLLFNSIEALLRKMVYFSSPCHKWFISVIQMCPFVTVFSLFKNKLCDMWLYCRVVSALDFVFFKLNGVKFLDVSYFACVIVDEEAETQPLSTPLPLLTVVLSVWTENKLVDYSGFQIWMRGKEDLRIISVFILDCISQKRQKTCSLIIYGMYTLHKVEFVSLMIQHGCCRLPWHPLFVCIVEKKWKKLRCT